MRPWRLIGIVFAATAVLGGCLSPAAVELYREQLQPYRITPTKAQLERVLARNPNEAQMALGYAIVAVLRRAQTDLEKVVREEFPSFRPEQGSEPGAAFADAVRLGGADPVPRLYYAIFLLKTVNVGDGDSLQPPETAEKRQTLVQAARLLGEAATRDPDNALIRYLMAYAGFATGDEADAWREIARAEECSTWTRHEPEAGMAVVRLLEAAGASSLRAPGDASLAIRAAASGVNAPLRRLGRKLRQRAEARRLAGDHDAELIQYGAILKLAHTLRMHTRDSMELLTGQSLVSMATGSFLTPEARQQLLKAHRSNIMAWLPSAQAQAFSAYARQHGQPELGELAVTEAEGYTADRGRLATAFDSTKVRLGQRVINTGRVVLALIIKQMICLVLGLFCCALAALVGRVGVQGFRQATFRPAAWLIGPGVLCAIAVTFGSWYSFGLSKDLSDVTRGDYRVIFTVISILAAIVWVFVLVRIARRREDKSISGKRRFGSRAATVFVTLLASLSVEFLFAVVALLLACLAAWYDSRLAMQILQRGELSVLGLR